MQLSPSEGAAFFLGDTVACHLPDPREKRSLPSWVLCSVQAAGPPRRAGAVPAPAPAPRLGRGRGTAGGGAAAVTAHGLRLCPR